MNFLAHFLFATRWQTPVLPLPAYTVGTALPDLLPLAAARAHLRPQHIPHSPAISPEDNALRTGAWSHLVADAAFHKTQAFAEAQTEAGTLLKEAGFTGIRVRQFFLSHILVELTLDAALLRTNPALGDEFYAAFSAADMDSVARWTEAALGRPLLELPMVLRRFADARYLLHYRTDEGVATGVSRLCARARQDAFEGKNQARLAQVVRTMALRLHDQTEALLRETARSLRQNDIKSCRHE